MHTLQTNLFTNLQWQPRMIHVLSDHSTPLDWSWTCWCLCRNHWMFHIPSFETENLHPLDWSRTWISKETPDLSASCRGWRHWNDQDWDNCEGWCWCEWGKQHSRNHWWSTSLLFCWILDDIFFLVLILLWLLLLGIIISAWVANREIFLSIFQ